MNGKIGENHCKYIQGRSQTIVPPGSAPLGRRGRMQRSTVVYVEFHRFRRGRGTPMSSRSSTTAC